MLACEQALLFGRVKRVSRERASERQSREGQSPSLARSREARFARPNRRACSQAKNMSPANSLNNLRKPLRKRKIAHKYGSLHISNRDAGKNARRKEDVLFTILLFFYWICLCLPGSVRNHRKLKRGSRVNTKDLLLRPPLPIQRLPRKL